MARVPTTGPTETNTSATGSPTNAPARVSFYWTSGDRYEGDFVEGKFNGEGIYYWADGDRYEGEFSDGDFHGYGIKYHADGSRQAGRWEHDNFVG